MLGQLLLEDGQNRRQKWNRMYDRVKNYEIDFEALENSFWKKNNLTQEKLYAVAKLMESCASHLYVTETISVEEEDLSRRIEAYIMKKIHKGAEITIEDIAMNLKYAEQNCMKFQITVLEWEFPNTFVE